MIFLVPYAYDRMPDGKPRKGVALKRLGSRARIDALLVSLIKIFKVGEMRTYWFVLTAGYSKESVNSPTSKVHRSIAEEMGMYIISQNGDGLAIIPNELAWGTYQETARAISTIRTKALVGNHVFVSTNLGHMPRVWLCWLFLKPSSWEVHFVLADHSFTKKEWLQETVKFFIYLYRFLFRKW